MTTKKKGSNRTKDREIGIGIDEYYAEELYDPEDVIREAFEALKASGVEFPEDESPLSEGMPILIAEAVNRAAKTISGEFYAYKAAVLNALVASGYECGRGEDGGFYVRHRTVGVAAFHDSKGEVEAEGSWKHRWSGISRQEYAFISLTNRAVRRLVAEATDPEGRVSVSDAALKRAIARILLKEK